MRKVFGRLLILVTEALDRNLVTVPEIEEYDSPSAGHQLHASACRNDMTYRAHAGSSQNQPD
jgi:hypothetical protein